MDNVIYKYIYIYMSNCNTEKQKINLTTTTTSKANDVSGTKITGCLIGLFFFFN